MVNLTKQLWSLARILVLALGFALACFGAYLASLQKHFRYGVMPAYVMFIFGLLAILIGVFWNLCHSMKSKMYQRGAHHHHIGIFTIDRPSSFPPSYEDSQRNQVLSNAALQTVVGVDAVDVVLCSAPPLYSQNASEGPDCTWSWERPPRYSQVERIQQGQMDAEELGETLSTH